MIKLNDNQTTAKEAIASIESGLKYISASRTGAIVDTQAGDFVSVSYFPDRRFEDLTETQEQRQIAKLLQKKAKEAIAAIEERSDQAIYETRSRRLKIWEIGRREIEELESAIVSLNLFIEELDRNNNTQEEEIDLMI